MSKNIKSKRQQAQDIEKTLKQIQDGLKELQLIWQTFEQDYSPKSEMQVRTQLQKLQKLRLNVRSWQEDQTLKDYHQKLSQARQLIEAEMSRFKTHELNTRKGKAQDNQDDIKYVNTLSWIARTVTYIDIKIGHLSDDFSGKKASECIKMLQFHKQKLRQIKKAIQNHDIDPEDLDTIKDQLDYLVENSKDQYPTLSTSIYEDINSFLPSQGEDDNDNSTNDRDQDDEADQSPDGDNDDQEADSDSTSAETSTQKTEKTNMSSQHKQSDSQQHQNTQILTGSNNEINILISGQTLNAQNSKNITNSDNINQKQYGQQRVGSTPAQRDSNIDIFISQTPSKENEGQKWSISRQQPHNVTQFSLHPTNSSVISQQNQQKAGQNIKKSQYSFSTQSSASQQSKYTLSNQKGTQQQSYQVTKFPQQNPVTPLIKGQATINYKDINFDQFSALFDQQTEFMEDYVQQQAVYSQLIREQNNQQPQSQLHSGIQYQLQSGPQSQYSGSCHQLSHSATGYDLNSPYLLLINLFAADNESAANQEFCTKSMSQYSQFYTNQFLTEPSWQIMQAPIQFTQDIGQEAFERWNRIEKSKSRQPLKLNQTGYIPTIAQKKAMEIEIVGNLSAETRLWLFYHRPGDIIQSLSYYSLLQQGWTWDQRHKKFFNGSVYYEPLTGRMIQTDTAEIPDSD